MHKREIRGIKTKKDGKKYVSNPILYEEMLISLEQGQLTDDAFTMISFMIDNLLSQKRFNNPDDKLDCRQTMFLDLLLYWKSFDPEKSNNPFAYFTSMLTNARTKAWNKLTDKMKSSDFISLDNNIHTL